jgi:hypothetical protein
MPARFSNSKKNMDIKHADMLYIALIVLSLKKNIAKGVSHWVVS